MFNNKVAKVIQELLVGIGTPVYYIDQIPSFDLMKNPNGMVGWDIEIINPMHCTEGLEYTDDSIVLNFDLSIVVYEGRMSQRNTIEINILNVLQPVVSGKRKPLISSQLTNAFIRSIVWSSVSEFPIPKTAQSNAEMSASVMIFTSSISLEE